SCVGTEVAIRELPNGPALPSGQDERRVSVFGEPEGTLGQVRVADGTATLPEIASAVDKRGLACAFGKFPSPSVPLIRRHRVVGRTWVSLDIETENDPFKSSCNARHGCNKIANRSVGGRAVPKWYTPIFKPAALALS